MKRVAKAGLLVILAVVLFAQAAFAEMQPPKLNQVQQDGALLQMYVSLTNELGDPLVSGFSPNQFNISMDGSDPLNVDAAVPFLETGMGVHYVFAVDVSKPVNRMMPDVRSGMSAFVDSLNENDAVSILTFGTDVKTLASHSTDKAALKEIIKDLAATEMDTVLYKGTYDAVRQAAKYGGRSAVIVITDGKDDPGTHNVEIQQKYTKDSIFESVKSAQVPLYCIGMTDNNDVDAESLLEFAQVTGGDQYLVPASQTINKLNTIKDLASNVVVLCSVLTNPEGKMNSAERHAFCVTFNGMDSNTLEQDISWAAVPTPSPTPAPRLTLTLDNQQFEPMPGTAFSFNGLIEYEGDVRAEDLVVLVNDEVWELQTHMNGEGQYTFTASGTVPESAQNVLQVRVAMRDSETASRSVSLNLATPTPTPSPTPTPTPSPTPTEAPTPTPAPKLTLTLTDSELMYVAGAEIAVRGVIDIEGKVAAEDLILYVNEEACSMDTWANGDNQYSFSANCKASDAMNGVLEVKVAIRDTNFSSIIQKLPLVTPTPAPTATPKPQLIFSLDEKDISVNSGSAKTITGILQTTGSIDTDMLVLLVNNEEWSMRLLANSDNQYTFSATGMLENVSDEELSVTVALKGAEIYSLPQRILTITPTPVPVVSPTPPVIAKLTEAPTVPPRQTAASMTVVVADDNDATEGKEETIIQKAMSWLEEKHIPIYVPIGVFVLLVVLVVVLILVLSRKKREPVVESTGNFITDKTGYAEASVTVRGEDDDQITRRNDSDKAHWQASSDEASIGQDSDGRTVHLDDSHTVRLDDEDFGIGATVRLEDEDESTMDLHMEIRQSGHEPESRMFTLRKDAEVTLGRSEQSDLVISGDMAIARRQMKLLYDGTDVFVEDLYSTNGTKLNGKRIVPEEKCCIADGDVITIGGTQITLRFSR